MHQGAAALLAQDRGTRPAEGSIVQRLRELAIRGLARMYRPDERLFVFRVQRTANGIVPRGVSRRYTAIALIGLAGEGEAVATSVLGGDHPHDVCGRLMADVGRVENLGDVALILWAARAVGYADRQWAWERLAEMLPAERPYPVVEIAWTLAALCGEPDRLAGDLRDRLADRLVSSFHMSSGMFPHVLGMNWSGPRWHVSSFADLVYPIHALARYAMVTRGRWALEVAWRCARQMCRRQGAAGQWWWHYDRRTGDVIERYPVYAVHQDAMAPMALFALGDAARADFTPELRKGLAWLAGAPELGGGSLIDERENLIWRKVARREPGRLCRVLQAVASRVHPGLRAPGLDVVFPPGAVDYEDRPYHLGWLLYAWSPARVARWSNGRGNP